MNRFKVIKGGETPKAGHSNDKDVGELFLCRCGSSIFREERFGIFVKKGKLTRGQRRLTCVHCNRVCWEGA